MHAKPLKYTREMGINHQFTMQLRLRKVGKEMGATNNTAFFIGESGTSSNQYHSKTPY